jgi:hypothetical protein
MLSVVAPNSVMPEDVIIVGSNIDMGPLL